MGFALSRWRLLFPGERRRHQSRRHALEEITRRSASRGIAAE
jgi:hypothetical protein